MAGWDVESYEVWVGMVAKEKGEREDGLGMSFLSWSSCEWGYADGFGGTGL